MMRHLAKFSTPWTYKVLLCLEKMAQSPKPKPKPPQDKTKVYEVNLSLNWARGWDEGTLCTLPLRLFVLWCAIMVFSGGGGGARVRPAQQLRGHARRRFLNCTVPVPVSLPVCCCPACHECGVQEWGGGKVLGP